MYAGDYGNMIIIDDKTGLIFAAAISAATIVILIKVTKSIYRFFNCTYTEPQSCPEPQYIGAKVVSKWNYMEKNGGATYSEHRIVYMAEFVTQLGKTVKYEIPQEIYLQLQQNQKGTLATIEGKFFGFE